MSRLVKFLRDESGMETVEWAVVAALLVLAAIGVWGALGQTVSEKIGELDDTISGEAAPQ